VQIGLFVFVAIVFRDFLNDFLGFSQFLTTTMGQSKNSISIQNLPYIADGMKHQSDEECSKSQAQQGHTLCLGHPRWTTVVGHRAYIRVGKHEKMVGTQLADFFKTPPIKLFSAPSYPKEGDF